MDQYDGSYLGKHTRMSKVFIRTAINLLEHCRLVSLGGKTKAKKCLANADKPYELQGGKYINAVHSSSYAQAYIAKNDDNIVIAFRGSGVNKRDGSTNVKGTLKNAIVDLKANFIKDKKFPGKVHKGFAEDYMQVREEIHQLFNEAKKDRKRRTVYITGFSLGAGLAQLCAYDLRKRFRLQAHVYLFACPAAGNHDFARAFERDINIVYRIAHEKDPVAQIPHGIFCKYKPVGKLFVFDEKGKQVHHNKIKLNFKANRAIKLAILSGRPIVAIIAMIVATIGLKFKKYHHIEHYQDKLGGFHKNYEKRRLRRSSMVQSAEAQYGECQQSCVLD